MKVDPVVNNNDELFMTNLSQGTKIKFLEADKQKRQAYIKDLQESLSLNKQSLLAFAEGQYKQGVQKLAAESSHLHVQLKKYYDSYMNLNASLLIEEQLRIQQKKFYNERILDFQTNMVELRKYLQDKEESFASVVNRLKKYEDLNEVTLDTKLNQFEAALKVCYVDENVKKIVEERDKYKNICRTMNVQLKDIEILKDCFENKKTYDNMKTVYLKMKDRERAKGQESESNMNHMKKEESNGTNGHFSEKSHSNQGRIENPNKQLIKLLKKQRLNNEILQQAFNDAIQKNEQLIIQNTTLVQANQQISIRAEKIQSKCYLLEQQLTLLDKSLAWKQEWKSKCDLERRERIKEFEQKGQQNAVCLIALQQDMQRLSCFIMSCGAKKLTKSSSNPNLNRLEGVAEDGENLQIEEI